MISEAARRAYWRTQVSATTKYSPVVIRRTPAYGRHNQVNPIVDLLVLGACLLTGLLLLAL
jgi:hypothetical protein